MKQVGKLSEHARIFPTNSRIFCEPEEMFISRKTKTIEPFRPQLHDTGFVSERHQFKVFSSLVCYYNFLYMKFLFNYIILSYF